MSRQNFDFISSATRLQRATKELRDEWEQLSETWHDGVQRAFQQRYLDAMRGQVQMAHTAIYEFAELVSQIVNDLEDPRAH